MKNKNKGLHAYRFKNNHEEKRFAEAWNEENNRTIGNDLIEWLLGPGNEAVTVSDRDRVVAATVIQWLGSEVVKNFLDKLEYTLTTDYNPFLR